MRNPASPAVQFAAALAALALALFGYGAWNARVAALSVRVANLDSQIQTASASARRLSAARAALAQLSGDEEAVHDRFVSEDKVVPFIDALEAMGKAFGASVSVDSVSSTKEGGNPALSVALTLSGSFDALLRTVGAVEFAPYALTVSSLSVAKDEAKGWSAALVVSVGSVAQAAASSAPVSVIPRVSLGAGKNFRP